MSEEFDTLLYDSELRKKWLSEEKEIFDNYQRKEYKYGLLEKMKTIASHSSNNRHKLGNYFFNIMYNESGQSIYMYRYINDTPTKIIDNDDIITKKGLFATIEDIDISEDSRYLSICFRLNGNDQYSLLFYDIENKKLLKERIANVSPNNISWEGNNCIYQTNYIDSLSSSNKIPTTEIKQHKLENSSSEDSSIFKQLYADKIIVTSHCYHHTIFIDLANLSKKNYSILYSDLSLSNKSILPLIKNETSELDIIGNYQDVVYFLSDKESNGKEIYSLNLSEPSKWVKLQVNGEFEILENAKHFNNCIVSTISRGPKAYLRILNLLTLHYNEYEFEWGTNPLK